MEYVPSPRIPNARPLKLGCGNLPAIAMHARKGVTPSFSILAEHLKCAENAHGGNEIDFLRDHHHCFLDRLLMVLRMANNKAGIAPKIRIPF